MYPLLESVYCPTALLPTGWAKRVLIEFGGEGAAAGQIGRVTADCDPRATSFIAAGPVIPGMVNLHSHSFQRAMSGLAERRGNSDDNFWLWREVMYRFAEQLGPEDIEAVATQLDIELLLNGYTAVGEFHYLHHGREGVPYANPAELSLRLLEAATHTGIRLTHLPVMYSRGGFAGRTVQGSAA